MNLEFYSVAVAGLGLIYLMIRNFRKDMDDKLSSIVSDISDIKERLSFLEASTFYTMPIESFQVNPRSVAAREMWKKRRAKKVEKKE